MKVRTAVQAGCPRLNHNLTVARARGVKVRSGVSAGGIHLNHNQTVVRRRRSR